MAGKASWDPANRRQKLGLVWKNRKKLAKFLMTTFAYRSSYLFYALTPTVITVHFCTLILQCTNDTENNREKAWVPYITDPACHA